MVQCKCNSRLWMTEISKITSKLSWRSYFKCYSMRSFQGGILQWKCSMLKQALQMMPQRFRRQYSQTAIILETVCYFISLIVNSLKLWTRESPVHHSSALYTIQLLPNLTGLAYNILWGWCASIFPKLRAYVLSRA